MLIIIEFLFTPEISVLHKQNLSFFGRVAFFFPYIVSEILENFVFALATYIVFVKVCIMVYWAFFKVKYIFTQ